MKLLQHVAVGSQYIYVDHPPSPLISPFPVPIPILVDQGKVV